MIFARSLLPFARSRAVLPVVGLVGVGAFARSFARSFARWVGAFARSV